MAFVEGDSVYFLVDILVLAYYSGREDGTDAREELNAVCGGNASECYYSGGSGF